MIAIVIPYYKIDYFEECLESLAKQTSKNFKVYIGNDDSPQDPTPIIRKFEDKLAIRYRDFDQNLGRSSLTKHWERCIDLIGGEEWVMLLCDDDLLSNNVVEEFYRNLDQINENNISVVRFATREIIEGEQRISKTFYHQKVQDYSDLFYERFFNHSRSSLSEHIFSRKQYQKHGFRNLPFAWHADDLAWLEMSEFGKVFTINEAIVFFRISHLNISRPGYLQQEKMETRYEFYTIIVEEYLDRFKEEHAGAILKRYELLTYELKRGTVSFWLRLLPKFFKHLGAIEATKFSRRIYLNKTK